MFIFVYGQYDIVTYNHYKSSFDNAYKLCPNIPKGLLEGVAFTNTRFTHIDETYSESPLGVPKMWGVMGLVEDGKNYFNENLKLISELSGISVDEIKNNADKNILAYALAVSELQKKYKINSINPSDYFIILAELSEIPDFETEIVNNYALNTYIYSVFVFLNNPEYSKLYEFPDYKIDLKSVFGQNYEILSSEKVLIEGDQITDTKGNTYISDESKVACPDYNVSHCFWVASPNYSSRNGTAISTVIIHTVQGSYSGCISWFQNPDANASTHYVVRSSDGQLTQMVLEENKAWHVGTENPYTVGYEHEGYVEQNTWYTPAMYQSSADLTADICDAYGINKHRMFYRDTLDDGTVLDYGNHVLGGSSYCTKICGHQHLPNQTHTDPGPYWTWDYYYRLVNQGLGTWTTLTASSGTFYDTGGQSGDYSDDERHFWLIQPENTESITLTFNSFALEDNYDFIYIYDGNNEFSPLIGRWNTQSPGTVVSTGGSLLVEFRSDCATTDIGWQASWTSVQADSEPPTTEIATTGGNWKTTDFTANFTDEDNIGVEKAFYQVIMFDGEDWFANSNNGFFADNFDTDMQQQWTPVVGQWQVSNGYLSQTDENENNSNIYAQLTQNLSNRYLYNFSAKLEGSGSNKRFGFHFFCDDATQTNRGNSYFIWFRIDDQTLEFYKVTNDEFTLEHTINNITTNLNELYNFIIIYDRTTGKTDVYRNNELLGSHIFSSPYTNGQYISFRTGNCQISVNEIKVYRSRYPDVTITVGNEQTNDIYTQNSEPTVYAAKIKSIVNDYAGNLSEIAFFDLNVDFTAPSVPVYLNDGIDDDIDFTDNATELSANWGNSFDTNSGITNYFYSIGTTLGGTDIVDWSDNSNSTSTTVSSLSLQQGITYYFNVKSENSAGFQSEIISSDGVVLTGSVFAAFTIDDEDICVGQQVNFTNTSQNAVSYLWNFEGGTPETSTDENPIVTYNYSGDFDVQLIAYGIGEDSAVYNLQNLIRVYSEPVAYFSTEDTLVYLSNPVVEFTNLSENATSYFWNFGDGYSSIDENPTHYYTAIGFFDVMLVAKNQGCENDTLTLYGLVNVLNSSYITQNDLNEKFTISPNPFNNRLTIYFMKDLNEDINIEIFDISGKKCNFNTLYGEDFIEITPLMMESGLYFFKIQLGTKSYFQKIIKLSY